MKHGLYGLAAPLACDRRLLDLRRADSGSVPMIRGSAQARGLQSAAG